MLKRLIGEDVRLRPELEPAVLLIHADPGLLEQTLVNLAVNARDAMSGGGELMVETSRARIESGEQQQPEAKPGLYARPRGTDSGAGIAPEHLPHIFEPFFTTKDVGKGTGLGLATVFGIIQQHGGWVRVDSEVTHGMRFEIFLPLAPEEGRARRLGACSARSPSPRRGSAARSRSHHAGRHLRTGAGPPASRTQRAAATPVHERLHGGRRHARGAVAASLAGGGARPERAVHAGVAARHGADLPETAERGPRSRETAGPSRAYAKCLVREELNAPSSSRRS